MASKSAHAASTTKAPMTTAAKKPTPAKTAVSKPKPAAKKAVPVAARKAVKAVKTEKAPVKARVMARPAVPEDKPLKVKHKLVRDSFTMPKGDFDLIAVLKERALGFKQPAKKSELLRAGLHALVGLPDDALKATLGALESLKPGRPKKAD